MAAANQKLHVILLPSPGIGHLVPFVELAKRLVVAHDLTATIIVFSSFSSPVQRSLLSSLPTGISTLSLPPAPLDDLPAGAHIITRLSLTIARSIPAVRDCLRKLKSSNSRTAAYIVDLFGGDTLPAAAELAIPRFMFLTTNFFYLSFLLNLPALHDGRNGDSGDQLLRLPGCLPLHPKDFSRSTTDKTSDAFAWMVRHAKQHEQVAGIMVNSFEALEGSTFKFLKNRGGGKPPVFPVGPLVFEAGADTPDSGRDCSCVRWLDEQPEKSVLFVAFGSGGALSFEQTREVALGLELSGRRFLWAVRTPAQADASANYFTTLEGKRDPLLGFLPPGFAERTKEKGLVVPFWAPQARILAHRATGGFLSHCGWNSALESIGNGVPMIAWPLYSEQHMNAVLLVEGAKVALRPTARSEGLVTREEIAGVVKDLMEGEAGKDVRRKMSEMKVAAGDAAGVGGGSYHALASIVDVWKTTT